MVHQIAHIVVERLSSKTSRKQNFFSQWWRIISTNNKRTVCDCQEKWILHRSLLDGRTKNLTVPSLLFQDTRQYGHMLYAWRRTHTNLNISEKFFIAPTGYCKVKGCKSWLERLILKYVSQKWKLNQAFLDRQCNNLPELVSKWIVSMFWCWKATTEWAVILDLYMGQDKGLFVKSSY